MRIAKILLIAVWLMVSVGNEALAKETHTVTGVITSVQIFPKKSFLGKNLTVITFEDGRIYTFEGIILGNPFTLKKKYTKTHDNDWVFVEYEEVQ